MNLDVFSEALKKAIKKELAVPELFTAANALVQGNERTLAITLYKEWLAFNADNPLLHAVYFNFSIVLSEGNALVEAREALQNSLAQNPNFLPAIINLGSVEERLGQIPAAIDQWFSLVNRLGVINSENINYKTMALKQSCRVLESINALGKAEEVLRMSLDADASQREIIQHLINIRLRQNKFPVVESLPNLPKAKLLRGIAPLTLLNYSDDPLFQLATANAHCRYDIGRPGTFFRQSEYVATDKKKLRIGYVSSDLRAHAVGYLTAEVFELHDRQNVDVYVYYCGVPYEDPLKERIRQAADVWVNVTGQDQAVTAARIRDDQIDILVDMNGYTKDGLFQLFAMRPAPIIVNWLGYPGTLGTPYHHYIIADNNIIPPESELYYSEKVLRLPCYQSNDRKRPKADHIPTRAEYGLPEDAMVYCCFNGTQKISNTVFKRWMDILRAVPNSVLWLLKCGENSDAHLLEMAAQQGIHGDRIVFAERRPNADHVARYVLADLFLDTFPYGAHTTASDALWMGVPILTVPGRSFAARVCASLVQSAGVPEFICPDFDTYMRRAIEFGLNPSSLLPHRQRLHAMRDSCVLFDTPLLVQELERLYRVMWDDFQQGKLPRPNLRNLEVYHEIGSEMPHNNDGNADPMDYHPLYRARLQQWHDFAALPADGRLWTDQDAAG